MTAPILAEVASQRTRHLAAAFKKAWPNDPAANQLVKLLELWAHRERDRNNLVHGIFSIKGNGEGWVVIITTHLVKKQAIVQASRILTEDEAAALLAAVIKERKTLTQSLDDFCKKNF